jgi:hypothetical protein
VAIWGNDLHSRGPLEAWKQISSKDKWLEGRFLPGESLQLVRGGNDITNCKTSLSQKPAQRRNKGEHVIWIGPQWNAYLLFPVVNGLDLGSVRVNR